MPSSPSASPSSPSVATTPATSGAASATGVSLGAGISLFSSPCKVTSGARTLPIWFSSHACRRSAARSRAGTDRRSSAISSMRGFRGSCPFLSRPTMLPFHHRRPCSDRLMAESGALARPCAREAISPASPLSAAERRALPWMPMARGSGTNEKPCSRPTYSPSTMTSPSSSTVATNSSSSRRRRISTLVRRSTKRWVSFSCSASDNRSSTALVRSCQ